MKHLFEIDQRARNRRGEYTIIALEGDKMTIRYDDGTESVVGQAMQARIQDNMRIDEQVSQEEAERAAAKRNSSSSSGGRSTWGRGWSGFENTDMQNGTTGTHWRSRNGLGGAVALQLSTMTGVKLESTAPWRIAESHIYDPKCYDKQHRNAQAKMLVKTTDEGCWYGFYIERSIDPMDDTWDWTRLVPALAKNKAVQGVVWSAMQEHGMSIKIMADQDETPLATATAAAEGAIALTMYENGEPEGDAEITTWADLAAFLNDGRKGEWMNLYLVRQMDCVEAMDAGQPLAGDAAKLMAELWPLYQACVN